MHNVYIFNILQGLEVCAQHILYNIYLGRMED